VRDNPRGIFAPHVAPRFGEAPPPIADNSKKRLCTPAPGSPYEMHCSASGTMAMISGKRPRCWETTVVGATKPNARGTGRAGSRLLLRCGHPLHREAGTTGRSH
jgi:hypothetical protein